MRELGFKLSFTALIPADQMDWIDLQRSVVVGNDPPATPKDAQ